MSALNLNQFFSSRFLTGLSLMKSLGEDFSLCDHDTIVFRWADFDEACELIKLEMESNVELQKDFARRDSSLKRLQLIPIWIKTTDRIYQSTVFDMYERYLLNHTKIIDGVDAFGKLEISFISGSGPFKSMGLTECFNAETYRDFIIVYLLQNKLPRREYRIRTKCKILFEHGNDYTCAELAQIEQLTSKGILFSMDSDVFGKTISKEEEFRVLLNTSVLKNAIGKNIGELKQYLSQYAFNLMFTSNKEDALYLKLSQFSVQASFDYMKDRKVYLFISYDSIAKANPETAKNLKDFILFTKGIIKDHFSLKEKMEKSA
ncbi:MAG: hypothetical protein AB7I27_00750 [Bacteriovoracaceae bacterium]